MTDEYKDVIEQLERINFPPEYDDGYFEAIDKAIALLKRDREGHEDLQLLVHKLCTLLDRIDVEENIDLVGQRLDILKEHGILTFGPEDEGLSHDH